MRLTKLRREVNQFTKIPWKSIESMDSRLNQFKTTLPLIMSLKNPAMRARHWLQLQEEIHKQFDPEGKNFTLEKVFSLGLHLHETFIGELSNNANKELAIEQSLIEIAEAWKDIDIDTVEYKEVYYKIRSTEDLYGFLEDHQVTLSAMKTSRFYLSFEEKITKWEKTLSHISEVIDLILQVQKKWMYLHFK